jgi:N-acetylneuraminate synthase
MSSDLNPKAPQIIVEVGQAHEGSESQAHAYIDEVSAAGADGIKFQLHIASEESSNDDIFRNEPRYGRESRYEYWKRVELPLPVIEDLVEHSHEKSISIGFSTFSLQGLGILSSSGIDFLKIGSGEALQPWFLREAAKSELPIILSTGMSSMQEIAMAIQTLSKVDREVTLLQCTSRYPAFASDVGLNLLADFQREFAVPVGLSDHTGELFAPLAALADGAAMVEIHGTFSKKTQSPDALSSLKLSEIAFLCEFRNHLSIFRSNAVDKDAVAANLSDMRTFFGRSIATRVELSPGDVVRSDHIYFAKPGVGLAPDRLEEYLGVAVRRKVHAGSILRQEDFEV